MFQVDKIQTGLLGLVGVRQPFNPEYQKFDAANLVSRSALYIDDVSGFNAEFFIETQNYAEITDADLNDHLRNLQKAAIVSVCQQVFGQESYIDRNLIYSHAAARNSVETVIPNGFVGYKIKPSVTKNVAFKITDIRCEFQGTGDLTIVLFNSAVNTPLFSETVAITQTFHKFPLGWEVTNTDGDYKGEYYLGFEYDGGLVPFKRDYESSNIMNYLSELCIEKVYVEGADAVTLFNIDDAKGLSQNTGLNPDITVYDDFTDLILNNESLFAQAIKYEYAIQVMQRYVSSVRSNRNERLSKDLVARTLEAIEGSSRFSAVNVTGVRDLLGREVSMLKKTIAQMKDAYFGSGIQTQTVS